MTSIEVVKLGSRGGVREPVAMLFEIVLEIVLTGAMLVATQQDRS